MQKEKCLAGPAACGCQCPKCKRMYKKIEEDQTPPPSKEETRNWFIKRGFKFAEGLPFSE